MNLRKNLTSILFACFGLLAGNAFADGPALEIGDPHGGSVFSQDTYSLGWKFSVESPIVVTALGFFDDNKDGMAGDHEVGLFDASDCTTLRTVTVKQSDPLVGFFRYRKVEALGLVAGKQYFIAAVTGSDKYLLSPTTLTASTGMTFIGFSIFGNTEATSELKCPNGSHSPGLKGDFGPNFYIGTLPSEIENPDGNTNDPNKRDTALTLFCNRNGVGLSNADCVASVADKGAPPRQLPTGSIIFEARDGFVPASAECQPVQADFSPGIGKCNVQFAVPAGFTIGAKFPIDATYSGDDNFNPSSTSHKLIIPACVGTTDKPCPNSIGLSFPGYPQLLKNKIALIASCGGSSAAKLRSSGESDTEAMVSFGGCSISSSMGLDVSKLFEALSFPEMSSIGAQIDAATANSDSLLYHLKEAFNQLDQSEWDALKLDSAALQRLADDIAKNKKPSPNSIFPSPAKSGKSGKKKDKSLKSISSTVEVKADNTKTINIKFDQRLKKLFSNLSKIGLDEVPMSITVKAKQKGAKSTATVTESINVDLDDN